jgi:hypothetical protein
MSQIFNPQDPKPFWKSDILTVILLLFCTPIGLIVMWLGDWPQRTKIVVTLIIVGLSVVFGVLNMR